MNKELLIRILQVTVILVILLIFIFLLLGINVFTINGVSKLPSILSIVVIFWGFYFSIGWKLPILKYVALKENLNGTWFGTYTSKNQITLAENEGQIAVIIRQNFLVVNVKSFTNMYVNHSYSEVLNYDNKSDTHHLIYLYSQNDFKPTDNNARKGTSELQLHYNLESKELFGNFWTNHNSQGYLNLKKISKKQAKSFSEALNYSKK
jgi:hypothetical protein